MYPLFLASFVYLTSGRSGRGRIRPAILALTAIGAFATLPDPAHAAGAALCSNPVSQLSAPRDEAAAGQRDLLLTDAALRYARDMANGRVEIESLEGDVDFPRATVDPVPGLRLALAQNRLSAWLATLPSSAPEYRRPVGAYTHYRDLAAKGGWPQLPALKVSLKPGHSSPIVPLLARRLVAEGDLGLNDNAAENLDGEVLEALKHFQARHDMDTHLLDLLVVLRGKLDTAEPYHVISGYRSPKTNGVLARASHGVAKRSLHMEGRAIDIRVPGRDLKLVHGAALALRRGRVGYYPKTDFVHVDVGKVRHWRQGREVQAACLRRPAS